MLFESVTYWRSGAWLVRVQAGFTNNRASAEAFGLLPMRLERDHDRLVLLTAQTGVELGEAYDENITVFRLKAGVDVATPVNLDDYKQEALPISRFTHFPELEQLTCVGHGVNEVDELALAIPFGDVDVEHHPQERP